VLQVAWALDTRDLGHRQEALTGLRRFLVLAPHDSEAGPIRRLIAQIQGRG
jgi:hypothetical protein